ncbi:MAG: polyprenyl synthetase family protein [Rhodospirillales bacterium]
MGVVVNLDEDRIKKSSLDALKSYVADDLKAVNQLILRRMDSQVDLVPQLAGHIIVAGGKRLRPLLTLGAAKLCQYTGDRHISLATCVEFIHTATLLHDDVVDESHLRRGQETANALFGNQASVLVGDFLFSRSFEIMIEDGSLDVLRILSHASSIIAEGEVLQLMTTNDTQTSEDTYLEVIKAKTAQLFAAACRIGAVVSDRPRIEEEALESYGMNLGIAFQLIDDVLDYSAKQATLGKSIGDDFKEGKISLPVILAFRRGDELEREFWHRTLEKLDQNEDDFAHALHLMEKHGALKDSVERARHYGAIARDSLGIFKDGPIKVIFGDLIDFCIERAH